MLEGYGVKISHGAGPTEITNVIDVEAPEGEMGDIDTSHMQSAGRAKTYKPGWLEPGEMGFTMHNDSAQVAALYTLRAARTVEPWIVEWIDGSKFTSDGYVKTIGQPTEREGLTVVDVTIKLSGLPNFAEPAAP